MIFENNIICLQFLYNFVFLQINSKKKKMFGYSLKRILYFIDVRKMLESGSVKF